jgi:hypothetical protein
LAVGRSLPGRGAWLCKGSVGCAERAARRGAFPRALRDDLAPGSVGRLIDRLRDEAVQEQPVEANGAPGVREDRGQVSTSQDPRGQVPTGRRRED